MRPILFGVRLDEHEASFDVLFPNDQVDGDHQVATVRLTAAVATKREAEIPR